MSQWRLVAASNIDSTRWNECVRRHRRELFSEYWYWTAVCTSWQAWIKGDYEDVLALPIERKWGVIPFLRTPLYVKWIEGDTSQLKQLIHSFFGFKRVHVLFEIDGASQKSVQTLKLDKDWKPSRELAKNIRKSQSENPQFIDAVSWADFSQFMNQHHPYNWPAIQQQTMKSLYEASFEKGMGKIVGVKMHDQWAAMQFLLREESRAYLIQNAVSAEWRSREPMPFLLHTLFTQWQSQSAPVTINFMGSSNPGVARFNEKFGANTSFYWEFPGR